MRIHPALEQDGEALGGLSSEVLGVFVVNQCGRRLTCRLTPRWSGRVGDKVPSSCANVRAAQLNR